MLFFYKRKVFNNFLVENTIESIYKYLDKMGNYDKYEDMFQFYLNDNINRINTEAVNILGLKRLSKEVLKRLLTYGRKMKYHKEGGTNFAKWHLVYKHRC